MGQISLQATFTLCYAHILFGLIDPSLPVSPVETHHACTGVRQETSIQPLTVASYSANFQHWMTLKSFKNSLMLSTCLQRNIHVSKVQSESSFHISCPSLEAPQLQKNILHDFKHAVGLLGHYLKLNKEFSTYFRYTLPIFCH